MTKHYCLNSKFKLLGIQVNRMQNAISKDLVVRQWCGLWLGSPERRITERIAEAQCNGVHAMVALLIAHYTMP